MTSSLKGTVSIPAAILKPFLSFLNIIFLPKMFLETSLYLSSSSVQTWSGRPICPLRGQGPYQHTPCPLLRQRIPRCSKMKACLNVPLDSYLFYLKLSQILAVSVTGWVLSSSSKSWCSFQLLVWNVPLIISLSGEKCFPGFGTF